MLQKNNQSKLSKKKLTNCDKEKKFVDRKEIVKKEDTFE